MLKEIQQNLQNGIVEAFELLVPMQQSLKELESNINDKDEAMKVDIDQYNLNEKSGFVSHKPFSTRTSDK